jgi:transcriptional regulator with XRE-family HTH domain
MRRGTTAAGLFGDLLRDLRIQKGLTMREVGERIGSPAATVSQAEKGKRAVKEPKLGLWATALKVDESFLRHRWESFQREFPDGPVVRRRGKSSPQLELFELIGSLTAPERNQAVGYIHRLIEERK